MREVDPKVTAELQACVGPALFALAKALRQMKSGRVPLDHEVYRRVSWARMAMQDLQCALRYSDAARSPGGLFDGIEGET